jgi:hypothetical protein
MIFTFPIVIAEKWERKFPALQYLVCPERALFVGTGQIGKPNNLQEMSEIEKYKEKYEYIFALYLK